MNQIKEKTLLLTKIGCIAFLIALTLTACSDNGNNPKIEIVDSSVVIYYLDSTIEVLCSKDDIGVTLAGSYIFNDNPKQYTNFQDMKNDIRSFLKLSIKNINSYSEIVVIYRYDKVTKVEGVITETETLWDNFVL